MNQHDQIDYLAALDEMPFVAFNKKGRPIAGKNTLCRIVEAKQAENVRLIFGIDDKGLSPRELIDVVRRVAV
jgi:hypothetical protein